MKLIRVPSCSHESQRQSPNPSRRSHTRGHSEDNAQDHARGHVLLLTLFTLMIVVTSVSLLARQSARKALKAIDIQDQLQLKWGRHSLEITLANYAPHLHHQLAATQLSLDPEISLSAQQSLAITLGQFNYVILVGDENAKLNADHGKLTEVHPDIQRPISYQAPVDKTWTGYFPNLAPQSLTQTINSNEGTQLSIAARISPWHDGKINPLRVSEATLSAHLSGHLPPKKIKKLLKHRSDFLNKRMPENQGTINDQAQQMTEEASNAKEPKTLSGTNTDKVTRLNKRESDTNTHDTEQERESATRWHWKNAAADLNAAEKERLSKLLIHQSNTFSSWIICKRVDTPIDMPRYRHGVYEYTIQEIDAETAAAAPPLDSQSPQSTEEVITPSQPVPASPSGFSYKLARSQLYNW